jgi:16S rRNA (cytosine1402-N4)-methyltransferase
MNHIPVLKKETVTGLNIKPNDIIFDGTLGAGGHSAEILKLFKDKVKIIAVDLDKDSISRSKISLSQFSDNIVFKIAGFQEIDKILKSLKISEVNKIMLDLGINSFQLEESGRGFSFQKDEPLLMTLKKDLKTDDLTAKEIVNFWEEESLADIIWGFGGERYARRIAKAIVENRQKKKIETTFDLVKIIEDKVGSLYLRSKIHPATKTFQALRIAANSELRNLQEVIEKGFKLLKSEGRMAIISFHSLEDRIVKREFSNLKKQGFANIITKKPIVPGSLEIINNPRARSAKLRIIEKI